MTDLETIQKLSAKLKLTEGNFPSVIDDKYKLENDDFDKRAYESDKSLYFQDVDCLVKALSFFNEKIAVERALSII